jgi:predicted AAA+ superfamily ATPase
MSVHPVLAEKLSAALKPAAKGLFTMRDAELPAVPGKVHAVIGMRRAGKTTFLRQLQERCRVELPPERAVYLSFDDDRLSGIGVEQLGFLLEEYYRQYPAFRAKETVHWFLDEIQLVPE